MISGRLASSPATSSMPGSLGSAMEKPVLLKAHTSSLAGWRPSPSVGRLARYCLSVSQACLPFPAAHAQLALADIDESSTAR